MTRIHLPTLSCHRKCCSFSLVFLTRGGEESGEGAAPPPQQKRNLLYILHRGNLLYILHRVKNVNAHPHYPSPLAVSKSYFSMQMFFSGVRLFAYRCRHLSNGFRPPRIIVRTNSVPIEYGLCFQLPDE